MEKVEKIEIYKSDLIDIISDIISNEYEANPCDPETFANYIFRKYEKHVKQLYINYKNS
jgi:hypothetical protein